MKNQERVIIITLFLLVISINLVPALEGTRIIANSEDWKDVYSTMLYASLTGVGGEFLTSTAHGPILLNAIPITESVGIVSSTQNPFVFGYEGTVRARGYEDVEELEVDSANLELIEEQELEDIENFVIVGNNYGFSAIAVIAYAIQTESWVFLADRVNIGEIENILANREVNNVLIYGYVEREVLNALEPYNPEIINSGDRFQDNIDIVKKLKKISDTKQIILSNGEFIEKEVTSGIHPVVFTGRDNVPEQIAAYLKESDISVGVLIGNELINAATNIRRSTGISVMVKFAQGARSQTAGVSAVEGLDLFYLPSPNVILGIQNVRYNRASKKVEITYHSTSNVPIYFKGTLTASSEEGDRVRAGDLEPIFIAPNDYKTIVYPDIELQGEELKAELVTFFGEVPTSLDRRLDATIDMNIANVLDKCDVEPQYVKYNVQRELFIIAIKNKGEVDCYVDLELADIKINNIKQTIGIDGSQIIKTGKKAKIEIVQRMTEEDLQDNPYVDLIAYYGEKEDSLVHLFKKKYELDIDRYTTVTYIIIAIIILLILLLILWLKLRREEDNWN